MFTLGCMSSASNVLSRCDVGRCRRGRLSRAAAGLAVCVLAAAAACSADSDDAPADVPAATAVPTTETPAGVPGSDTSEAPAPVDGHGSDDPAAGSTAEPGDPATTVAVPPADGDSDSDGDIPGGASEESDGDSDPVESEPTIDDQPADDENADGSDGSDEMGDPDGDSSGDSDEMGDPDGDSSGDSDEMGDPDGDNGPAGDSNETSGSADSPDADDSAAKMSQDSAALPTAPRNDMMSMAGSPAGASDSMSPPASPPPWPILSEQPRHQPSDTFQDYGVNDFVDTVDDRLSTFALETDTASYTIARSFITGGDLPPHDAVRTEEFVNYFDYGYPSAPDEFTVSVEAAPSPFAADGDLLMRVAVQAPRQSRHVVQPDTIILVLDSSGSMSTLIGGSEHPDDYEYCADPWTHSGHAAAADQRDHERCGTRRIDLVHRMARLLLDNADDNTRFGVVAYETDSRIVVRPETVEDNRDILHRRIVRDVQPGGSTNVAAGLQAGYRMALDETDAGRTALVLLISDGVANVGAVRTDDILEHIGERSDIGLSTIGVGLGPFNDVLMEQLANHADGTYRYIDTPAEADRLLSDGIDPLIAVAARDAKIQIEFDPDTVAAYRLIGYENREIADDDFRDDTVDAGEIPLGLSSTALYELKLVDGETASRALAEVTLRYSQPASDTVTETAVTLTADDTHNSFDDTDAAFRLAAAAAELAETLRASPYADQPDMTELHRTANRLADELADTPDADTITELAALIAMTQDLR